MGATKPFTEAEIYYIQAMWPQMGATEIAKKLGRTKQGVNKKIAQLGLRQRTDEKPEPEAAQGADLVSACASGDRVAALEALRDSLAVAIVEAEYGRDKASLANRLITVLEQIDELKGTHEDEKTAEVTPFELICAEYGGRRKAASH